MNWMNSCNGSTMMTAHKHCLGIITIIIIEITFTRQPANYRPIKYKRAVDKIAASMTAVCLGRNAMQA